MLYDISDIQFEHKLSYRAQVIWQWMLDHNYEGSLRQLQKRSWLFMTASSARRKEIRQELVSNGYAEEFEVVIPKGEVNVRRGYVSKRIRPLRPDLPHTPYFGFTK